MTEERIEATEYLRAVFNRDGTLSESVFERADGRSLETIPGLSVGNQRWYRVNGSGVTGDQLRAMVRQIDEWEAR